jgi:hypothetical protein
MPSCSQQREIVRDLARRVAELAASEEVAARRRRWCDVNALRRPDRAPVWCRPAGCWPELLPEATLQCEDPFLRACERRLRMDLVKADIGDDHPFEATWDVGAVFECDSDYTWGLPTQVLVGRTDLGGWRYEPPLKTAADFERITLPTFTYNPTRTEEALSQAHDLLGDILTVQRTCGPHLHQTLGAYLDQLRGLGEMMLDLYVQPHLIHRLMAKILEACLRDLRAIEASGLLTPNNTGGMHCSDPINGDPPQGQVKLHHLWADGNSQEFDEVSPRQWDEFLLSYQRPIFQQFGLVHYGCCEDLTTKIGGVLSIPNLRIFVCSAWTDLAKVIEACGPRYCIMWRQSAAEVTLPDTLDKVAAHLDDGLSKLQGHYYQIVLRELQTLGGHPRRLHEWAQLAIAKAEQWA